MNEYVISREELRKWCSVPVDELGAHPDRKMELMMGEDKTALLEEIGNMITDEVIANNAAGKNTVWILPGGIGKVYDVFIRRVNEERISLKNLYVFHVDQWLDWEYRLFPTTNLRFSMKGKMLQSFYAKIDPELNVPEDQRYFPDPADPDLIDNKIEELGGVDTILGGVGCKGLLGWNERPISNVHHITLEQYANSKTRAVHMTDETILAYAEREFGGCYEALPPNGITIGMKSMLTAKRAIFIVMTGSWKETVVRVAMFSEPTVEYPVTLFPKYVPQCIMCCDRKTADHVISREYQDAPILR